MTERKHQLDSGRALQLLDRHWKWVTLAAWLILSAWFLYNRWSYIQTFTLVDTDDNMRMSQVRALLGGQDWYDLRQHRSTTGGETLTGRGWSIFRWRLIICSARGWRKWRPSASPTVSAPLALLCAFGIARPTGG